MKLFILLMVVKVFNQETHQLQDSYEMLNFKDVNECKVAVAAVLKSENVEKAYCTEFPSFTLVQ